VFRDFDMFGTPLPPNEADSILIIDTDAMLSLSIPTQGFQPVARRNQQIGESLRAMQRDQPAQRGRSDVGEVFNGLPLEEPFGLFTPEAPDHSSS
jgi:hypothetical protein